MSPISCTRERDCRLRGPAVTDRYSARYSIAGDVFEALTSPRSYRAEVAPGVALSLIRREAGLKLCPQAVAGLAAMVGESRKQMAV